ncbi:MAG: enoyl-CoA hydratase, partial [Planctomycetota bacterium]
LELKQKVVEEVEAIIPPGTIFASNTSSIPISKIAEKAKYPERFLGMHYFSPVPKMPLLEIIETEKTAKWALSTAYEAGLKQGKTIIVVGDGPGFYTTRILAPYMNEAILLLEEGAKIEDIDRAMKKFGFPVGPIALLDEVGIDVGNHVSQIMGSFFENRGAAPSKSLQKVYDAGYRGRKNKKGFYKYDKKRRWIPFMKKKKKEVNPEIYEFFGGPNRREFSFSDIQDRMSMIMVNEAIHCLQDGILKKPEDGDLGAIFGLGFPPFRGGPFRYIAREGEEKILKKLENLQSRYGNRFTPAPLLKEMVEKGESFYPSKEPEDSTPIKADSSEAEDQHQKNEEKE